MVLKKLLLISFIFLLGLYSYADQYVLEEAFPNLNFSDPLFLTSSEDGTNRIFVVEQDGVLKVFPNNPSVSSTKIFLDISNRVSSGGEMGLLGLAFHPDYANNGYFYVNYTASNPRRTIISRFQVTSNPDSADENSEFEILVFNQPYSNHNGGWIGFGPNDGHLYIATGDGGSGGDPQNYAQRIDNLLGKVLRLDVDSGTPYAIPLSNPFVDSTGNVKKEIYAWGLRNPWRCSHDPITGWLWVGDVGQNAWEEIDVVENGKNYGWRCYEGNHNYNTSGCNYPEYIDPVWEYSHSQGYSITGGYVYRGTGVPSLQGKYIYGDYGTRKLWALTYDGINPTTNELLLTVSGSISSFGVDEEQELYITSFNGNIYRFTPKVTSGENEFNPQGYLLEQNYPNPFNPSTIIKFNIAELSNVQIKIYNSLGKEIDTLEDGIVQPGTYGKNWNAERFSSGIYFVKMNATSLLSEKAYSNVIKMIFLK
ncbi:MAG: T9SS type A sorting domain-containing protein [Ignavibacteriaceae bacterium]|nr:PQQ-dependent sugar dehydrogenase [Ignavibacteria bacterium]NNJ52475.1 T9SS type A sorting domain-containing protein [Ignavibacteriaceae bacterium]